MQTKTKKKITTEKKIFKIKTSCVKLASKQSQQINCILYSFKKNRAFYFSADWNVLICLTL